MRDPSRAHPRALFVLILVSAFQAFTFHAVRSLMVGLTPRLGTYEEFGAVYGLFTMGAAWAPLLGGIAVDLGGARRIAVAGGAILAAGAGALALPGAAPIYAGLALVALGKGLLQIGVLALVADLYAPGDHRRDAGFTLFALGGIVGATCGPLGGGWVMYEVGVREGFAVAAAVALAAVAALALCRPPLAARGPSALTWPAGRAVAAFAVLYLVIQTFGLSLDLLDTVVANVVPAGTEGEQSPSVLEIIAPLAVEVVITVVMAWLWLHLGRRQPSSPAKILLGTILSALGFVVIIALARAGTSGALGPAGTASIVIPASVLVVAIAPSLVSRLARPRFRGTVLGLWLSAPELGALLLPRAERVVVDGSADVAMLALPGLALAAGVLGYTLLRRLGANAA
jgi:POT family proton-dependent oligopeptide transporter